MLKKLLKLLSKELKIKSFATKFGILFFLIGFSVVLVFIAGIVALLGTLANNIK